MTSSDDGVLDLIVAAEPGEVSLTIELDVIRDVSLPGTTTVLSSEYVKAHRVELDVPGAGTLTLDYE